MGKTLIRFFASLFCFILAGCAAPQTVTDRNQVKGTIHKALPQIRECYVSSLKERPDLKGKVVVQFEVDEAGKVPKCDIKSSDLNMPAVDKCVCDRISSTTFPPAPKAKKAVIEYPFVFNYKE